MKKIHHIHDFDKPETVVYHTKYTAEYVKDKIHRFHWNQLTMTEVVKVEKEEIDFDRNKALGSTD